MSSNVELTEDELEGLINSGGLKETTLKKRRVFLDKFKIYVADKSNEPFLEVMKDKSKLEDIMIRYLETIRITKKGTNEKVRPKALYFENILSHLKNGLSSDTGFDLNNRTLFAKLYKGINAIRRNIKAEGRGNVRHTPVIPQSTLQAIFALLAIVQGIMTARFQEDEVKYQEYLEKIPPKYR